MPKILRFRFWKTLLLYIWYKRVFALYVSYSWMIILRQERYLLTFCISVTYRVIYEIFFIGFIQMSSGWHFTSNPRYTFTLRNKQRGNPLNKNKMNKLFQILISTFFSFVAMLCNYEFATGNMTEGSFSLVVVINLTAIIFGIATLFSKSKWLTRGGSTSPLKKTSVDRDWETRSYIA